MTLLTRTLAGLALAAAIALAARRARALTPSGAWSALLVGTVATAAGWGWCAVLLTFFVPSTLLSRWRRAAKERVTGGIVDKGGERDAWQVIANGGVFALCAVGAIVSPAPQWTLAGLGALAGATADTWATEIGTAIGGVPRTLRGWRPVPPGTSGAVTTTGTLAMIAGALVLGTVAHLGGFDLQVVVSTTLGGIGGALADTVLGATVQERRWCSHCREATERRVHDCGRETQRRSGVAGVDNDVVNLTSSLAGGVVALLAGGVWG
ncbi:MAG: DUF92 domain-containing protein [Gemmatimonadaceae bacterium]|nr:DUF92 domain-containing protein [Gemmatimonadaceae bacterium]